MIDINKFENRIVNFKRISEGREDTVKEAEIRRLVYDQLAGMPRSVTARFVEPLNAVMTLNYDQNLKKFRGALGPDTLVSDFNIDDFINSSPIGSENTVIRSPRKNRAKF